MKFKTKPVVVQATRLTTSTIGAVGSWLVNYPDSEQKVVSNEDFVAIYRPAGRGDSKTAYETAKGELETPETTNANVVSGATT